MASGVLLSDPNLEVITIDDFTPGVQRLQRGGYLNTFHRKDGSASSAFRCYAVEGLGLCPFPQYISTQLVNNGTNLYTAICALTSIGADILGSSSGAGILGVGESLLVSTLTSTGALSTFKVVQLTNPATPPTPPLVVGVTAYTSTYAGDVGMVFNNMVAWFTQTAGPIFNVVGITIDPLDVTVHQLKWVTVPSWNTNANQLSGTITVPSGTTPVTVGPILVSSSRAAVIASLALEGSPGNIGAGFQNAFYVSDIEAPTSWSGPNLFAPSNSNLIGAWGSVSTGELVVIFQGTGMAVVSGDLFAPSSVINLPAVTGTGKAIGPAASTPIGLIYPTDTDGVYVWNGGNTSYKISTAIPDDQFVRSQYTADLSIPDAFIPCLTHHDIWNNWVMFANNWMYDCLTNSWWQVEDPASYPQFWVTRGYPGGT